jgi:hypothetical protein
MSQAVFPAIAAKTKQYTEKVYKDFITKHRIIREDFPAGALVMKQVIPRPFKAAPAWEGPYIVVRRTRGGAYVLRDATNSELAQLVPVSQLRLVSYEGNLSPDSFEVDHIVTHRGPPAKREYLIGWKGFAPEYDSWVADGGINALECVTRYWQTQGRQGRATPHPRTGGRVMMRGAAKTAPDPIEPRSSDLGPSGDKGMRPLRVRKPSVHIRTSGSIDPNTTRASAKRRR